MKRKIRVRFSAHLIAFDQLALFVRDINDLLSCEGQNQHRTLFHYFTTDYLNSFSMLFKHVRIEDMMRQKSKGLRPNCLCPARDCGISSSTVDIE